MPIYLYKFEHNNKIVEVMQKMCDKPLTEIDGKKVKRVPALSQFRLKGGGFYKNDYEKPSIF